MVYLADRKQERKAEHERMIEMNGTLVATDPSAGRFCGTHLLWPAVRNCNTSVFYETCRHNQNV